MSKAAEPLLVIRDLSVVFDGDEGTLAAIDGVSFEVPKSTTVALVGESGCGKSVTALSIMRLLPAPARITSGVIELEGSDLLALSEKQMRAVRGQRVSIVFQDPMSALNPVYSIGSQVVEAIRLHQSLSRTKARLRALELLERVGFPEPKKRFDDYPHEMSGGMRQRVMIAIALSCEPELIIADEPTTALDMLAAAQINALLADLKRELDMSLLLISHDVAMVAQTADEVVVLYAGQVVETGRSGDILVEPRHPYTKGLLRSVPPLRKRQRRREPTSTRLPAIAGRVPDPRHMPPGCRFAERCPDAFERCGDELPELLALPEPDASLARCFLLERGAGNSSAEPRPQQEAQ